MTLDEFAALTQRVIARSRDGFRDYLPTACYPTRRLVQTLVGLPSDADTEAVVVAWAARAAIDNEEFLVAFKVNESHFKIVRRSHQTTQDRTYAVDRLAW